MKKLYLICLLLPSMLVAQDYIPMLQEGNIWGVVGIDGFGGPNSNHSFSVAGEEIINNVTYKVISGAYCRFREEDEKIYAYEPDDGMEYLIYDFTVQVGDVVDLSYAGNDCRLIGDIYIEEMTVVARTTQFIAGENRTVIEFEAFGDPIETWIVGIGSSSGFHPNGNGIDSASFLTCFTYRGITYYFNGFDECIILETDDLAKVDIKLSPNPVTSKSILQLPSSTYADQLRIYNAQGKLIKEVELEHDYYVIDVTQYRSGLYFYQLFSEKQLLTSSNFIVR